MLEKLFRIIPEKACYDLVDFLQLPPIRRKLVFSRFPNNDSMKFLLILQFWQLFKYAELTEVVR